MDIWNVIP